MRDLYSEPLHSLIMDESDELARLKAMNADLLKISADLDAIVRDNLKLAQQRDELRDTLQMLVSCSQVNIDDYECRNNQAITRALKLLAGYRTLNQSSGD